MHWSVPPQRAQQQVYTPGSRLLPLLGRMLDLHVCCRKNARPGTHTKSMPTRNHVVSLMCRLPLRCSTERPGTCPAKAGLSTLMMAQTQHSHQLRSSQRTRLTLRRCTTAAWHCRRWLPELAAAPTSNYPCCNRYGDELMCSLVV